MFTFLRMLYTLASARKQCLLCKPQVLSESQQRILHGLNIIRLFSHQNFNVKKFPYPCKALPNSEL